ncbi:MAG: chorion class high-cysteine HCB protein 13 [Clostridiales bacterium]|nr:chorion class high-cysteine HCB protein 13 [Lachnospiraceae bacterium]MCD7922200.1 chorion class high-cysteine HCB protein 13 [Clostridiales bacterium]
MSDLAATNCGCGTENGGCNSIIWIILLLILFGNNNGSCFGGNGDSCCDSLIWICLLLCCCGNNGNGCGCF